MASQRSSQGLRSPTALQPVPASEQPAILGWGRNGDDVRVSQHAAVVKDSLGQVRFVGSER
jgi:hypothetical protein